MSQNPVVVQTKAHIPVGLFSFLLWSVTLCRKNPPSAIRYLESFSGTASILPKSSWSVVFCDVVSKPASLSFNYKSPRFNWNQKGHCSKMFFLFAWTRIFSDRRDTHVFAEIAALASRLQSKLPNNSHRRAANQTNKVLNYWSLTRFLTFERSIPSILVQHTHHQPHYDFA